MFGEHPRPRHVRMKANSAFIARLPGRRRRRTPIGRLSVPGSDAGRGVAGRIGGHAVIRPAARRARCRLLRRLLVRDSTSGNEPVALERLDELARGPRRFSRTPRSPPACGRRHRPRGRTPVMRTSGGSVAWNWFSNSVHENARRSINAFASRAAISTAASCV